MSDKIKVTFISPYGGNLFANGIRMISAYLKENGHHTNIIFLPTDRLSRPYSPSVVEGVSALCRDSDLIGISLMTPYFFIVKELTRQLKQKHSIPILWGGIHATIRPEECLEYADMVCVGEGEEAILELADRFGSGDWSDIKNIWVKKGPEIIRNEVRPLEEDLDKYPFPDFDLDGHYVIDTHDTNRVVPMTRELLEAHMGADGYYVYSSRGCPYKCTYCCNNALKQLYGGKGRYLRHRRVENVVTELEEVTRRYDFIKWIFVKDDTFFIRKRKEIEVFSTLYKQKVGLPLLVIASPLDLDEIKLRYLLDAGLFSVSMGIQSANKETLKGIYKRNSSLPQIQRSIDIINKYKSEIPYPAYHFLVDIPFEETSSLRQSVELAASLPQGTDIFVFPVTVYPGTELYDQFKKKHLIHDEYKEIYLKRWSLEYVQHKEYYSLLLFLCSALKRKMPPTRYDANKIIAFLLRRECVRLFGNQIVLHIIWYTVIGMIRVRPFMVKFTDPLHRPGYYLKKYTRKLLGKTRSGNHSKREIQQVDQVN